MNLAAFRRPLPHAAAAPPASTIALGKSHITVVPAPTVEVIRTVPPSAWAACFTIASPSPVPRVLEPVRAGSTW